MDKEHTLPKITVEQDFDEVFFNRVMQAIELNNEQGIENVSSIFINSGSYRPYCMSYNKDEKECRLDFYAAARVFGFQHTIDDIAMAISKPKEN